MAKRPRLITNYLTGDASLKTLLSQDRTNKALLMRVREKLPSPLAGHCVAALLHGDQLLIYVESSAWSSKLRFLSRNLCKKLQSDGLQIAKITTRVFLKTHKKRKKIAVTRGLSPSNAHLLNQTAEAITDPELSAALKRLSRHRA